MEYGAACSYFPLYRKLGFRRVISAVHIHICAGCLEVETVYAQLLLWCLALNGPSPGATWWTQLLFLVGAIMVHLYEPNRDILEKQGKDSRATSRVLIRQDAELRRLIRLLL